MMHGEGMRRGMGWIRQSARITIEVEPGGSPEEVRGTPGRRKVGGGERWRKLGGHRESAEWRLT